MKRTRKWNENRIGQDGTRAVLFSTQAGARLYLTWLILNGKLSPSAPERREKIGSFPLFEEEIVEMEMQGTKKVGVLGERNMRWYFGTQLPSLACSMLQTAVLSMIVYDNTKGSTYAIGLVWLWQMLPCCIFAPFAGVLLDKVSKKKVMLVTQFLGVIQGGALAYLQLTGKLELSDIYWLSFFLGLITAVDGPARNAIVKDSVWHEYNVRPAATMFTSLYNFGQVIGPGLAGLLTASVGEGGVFVINALSFIPVIVALCMMNMRPPTIEMIKEEKKSVWEHVKAGAAYTFRHPEIRACIAVTFSVTCFGFSYLWALPGVSVEMFGKDRAIYSWLAASGGFGAFIGSLCAIAFAELKKGLKVVPKQENVGWQIWQRIWRWVLLTKQFVSAQAGRLQVWQITCVAMLISAGGTVWFSKAHSVNEAMAGLTLMGFGSMTAFSVARSTIPHLAVREMIGIVMGYTISAFFTGMVASSRFGGMIADTYGSRELFLYSGIAFALSAAGAACWPAFRKVD